MHIPPPPPPPRGRSAQSNTSHLSNSSFQLHGPHTTHATHHADQLTGRHSPFTPPPRVASASSSNFLAPHDEREVRRTSSPSTVATYHTHHADVARPSQILHPASFFQNGAKSGFEMCFGPSTLGAGVKTRLESRIKKFTPHCVCRPPNAPTTVLAWHPNAPTISTRTTTSWVCKPRLIPRRIAGTRMTHLGTQESCRTDCTMHWLLKNQRRTYPDHQLWCRTTTATRPVNLKSLHNAPFFQNGLQAKSGFEMCFGPSTLGAGAKTRLESRIKKFTPHCVCRPLLRKKGRERCSTHPLHHRCAGHGRRKTWHLPRASLPAATTTATTTTATLPARRKDRGMGMGTGTGTKAKESIARKLTVPAQIRSPYGPSLSVASFRSYVLSFARRATSCCACTSLRYAFLSSLVLFIFYFRSFVFFCLQAEMWFRLLKAPRCLPIGTQRPPPVRFHSYAYACHK